MTDVRLSEHHLGEPHLVKANLMLCKDQIQALEEKARDICVGRIVEIVEDWRDQPHGRSKPSLKGKQIEVDNVVIDGYWGVCLGLKGCRCYIPMENVRFLT